MKKILIFGDSFSCEYSRIKKEYIDWKGYEPKTFFQLISNDLNIPYLNYALGGNDNYSIFHSVINNFDKINNDDIIIIGWSLIERFRVSSKYNKWESMGSHYLISETTDISELSLMEILVNRNSYSKLYHDELNNFIFIINNLFKNNIIIHWSWVFYNSNYKINLTLPVIKYTSIYNETNYKIVDYHLDEKSSKLYYGQFLNYIISKIKK